MALAEKIKNKANHAMGLNAEDARISKSYFTVSFIALLFGGIFGLLQGLNRAGLLELPSWYDYYQVLTSHGLLLVLVFTSFFAIGYFYAGMSHTLGGLLPKVRKMVWIGFGMKLVGFVFSAVPIVMGEASVKIGRAHV